MPTIVRGISENSDNKSRLQIRKQQNKRKSRKSRRKRGQSGNRSKYDHGCQNLLPDCGREGAIGRDRKGRVVHPGRLGWEWATELQV